MTPEQIATDFVKRFRLQNIDNRLHGELVEALRSARLAGWRAGVEAAAQTAAKWKAEVASDAQEKWAAGRIEALTRALEPPNE